MQNVASKLRFPSAPGGGSHQNQKIIYYVVSFLRASKTSIKSSKSAICAEFLEYGKKKCYLFIDRYIMSTYKMGRLLKFKGNDMDKWVKACDRSSTNMHRKEG